MSNSDYEDTNIYDTCDTEINADQLPPDNVVINRKFYNKERKLRIV